MILPSQSPQTQGKGATLPSKGPSLREDPDPLKEHDNGDEMENLLLDQDWNGE